MTLTEQWKKGELPFGCYYIKDINDEIFADHYTNNGFRNGFEDFFDDEIKEVLAHVPSYEEWQELKEFADYSLHNRDELTRQINFWMDKHTQVEKENTQLRKWCEEFNALDVAKENQRLKEMLSKARDSVQFDFYEAIGGGADYQAKFLKDLLTAIDNAIGEK